MKRLATIVSLLVVFAVTSPASVEAQVFSLDAATAPLNGTVPDDLHLPGVVPPPPPVILPGALGIPGGPPPVDVDAFTFTQVFPSGHTILGAEFSVDAMSLGLTGTAVAGEAATGDQPSDIFGSALGGGNVLNWDGDGIPTPGAPVFGPLGVFELGTVPPPIVPTATDVDGWDATPPFGPPMFPGIVYSIGAVDALVHPVYAGTGATGGYLFFSPPVPGYSVLPALFATDVVLGLGPLDDIDAVAIIEDGAFGPSAGDVIYFSLTPGSPTLAGLGASAADVLVTSIGGAPAVAIPAASLGLAAMTDNLNALDLFVVPEPATGWLLLLGAAALVARRRRT